MPLSDDPDVKSILVSCSTLFVLLIADSAGGGVSSATAEPIGDIRPTVDVVAPQWSDPDAAAHRGGVAARVELAGDELTNGSSVWYRLAFVGGGSRLQVFEHYAPERTPDANMVESEVSAWHVANEIVGQDSLSPSSDALPDWARVHTGNDTGYSAGLIITLAYIDALTRGALVGDLRVAGTGGIGPDGVVIPIVGIEPKIAAAKLTHPDVIFAPAAPELLDHVTVIESRHTRVVDPGYTVAQWLDVDGYERAGRAAARRPGILDVVVVHDVRQALAYLCGRTSRPEVCADARQAATIPIGVP